MQHKFPYKETIYHLNELGQAIVFKLNDHETRIENNEQKISSLEKDNEILRREIDELKRQMAQRTIYNF